MLWFVETRAKFFIRQGHHGWFIFISLTGPYIIPGHQTGN